MIPNYDTSRFVWCKLTVGVSMSENGRLSLLALWQTGTVQGVP